MRVKLIKILFLVIAFSLFINIEKVISETTQAGSSKTDKQKSNKINPASQKPPLGIREIKFGMPCEDIKKVSGVDCPDLVFFNGHTDTCSYCEQYTTIKGVYIKVQYGFTESKTLERISGTFDTNNFESIKNAVIEKWGKPNTIETGIKYNSYGAKVENLILKWELPDGTMLLESVGSKINEGFLGMLSNLYLQKKKEYRDKSPGF